jgi:hypothetical protein
LQASIEVMMRQARLEIMTSNVRPATADIPRFGD